MFDNLSDRLSRIVRKISGRGRLTEENIKNSLREVRMALLEADVALPVVQDFINRIKKNTIGKEVNKGLTTGQEFIKCVHTELVNVMGSENNSLNLTTSPPSVILITGLQGAGKTTSVGKLGKYLHDKKKKKVLVVSADVYRPAAIKQMEILAKNVNVDFFPSHTDQKPIDIVNKALNQAKQKLYDVLLVDTAGCMSVDKNMIEEIILIHTAIKPIETIFVIDAMMGQDAANSAKIFNLSLPLTGIILTKIDGDARGGSALSTRWITGKPIKFIGVGEKADALELFYPDRLARRILGMGDILSLIEDIESKVNRSQMESLINKIKKGDNFTFIDFLNQLKQIRNMGGITSMMQKLPGIKQLPDNIKSQMNDDVLMNMESIINSMTTKERYSPNIIKSSHKRRIAAGSGTKIQDVNQLLRQFNDMQRIMKKIKKEV